MRDVRREGRSLHFCSCSATLFFCSALLILSSCYKMVCTGGGCQWASVNYDWVTATITPQGGLPQPWLPQTFNLGGWLQSPTYTVTPGGIYTITITNHDDQCGQDATSTYIDDVVFGGPSNSTTIVANLAQ